MKYMYLCVRFWILRCTRYLWICLTAETRVLKWKLCVHSFLSVAEVLQMYRFVEENSATVHKSYDLVCLITKFVHTCIFEQTFAVDFHYNKQFRNFESGKKKKLSISFLPWNLIIMQSIYFWKCCSVWILSVSNEHWCKDIFLMNNASMYPQIVSYT